MHICFKCGQEVGKGNLRSPTEVSVKCSTCVQGEVQFVENHPEDYPDAHRSLGEINRALKAEAVRRRRERRESRS